VTASRGSYKFFLEMKKKPALQKVLDSLEEYDHDQLELLTGPVFPLWVKKHLHTLKDGATDIGYTTPAHIEELANQMQKDHTVKEDDTFEVRRYNGQTKWIGDPNKSQVEGNPGDLFQLLGYNEIFWSTNLVKTDHATMVYICSASESLGLMTAYDYKCFQSEELKKKLNVLDYTPDPTGKITSGDFTNSADRYRGEIINSESNSNIGTAGVPVLGQSVNIAGHAVQISKI